MEKEVPCRLFLLLHRRFGQRLGANEQTKEHIVSCGAITPENSGAVAKCFEAISKITKELGLTDFRVVSNCGPQAGQTVFHLHFHVLSGRDMTWPPG